MNRNYFISYDLFAPGQSYDAVIAAIKKFNGWAKVHKSFWYVHTPLSVDQVFQQVWNAMDKNDSLMVVDIANKTAKWINIDPAAAKYIQDHWSK